MKNQDPLLRAYCREMIPYLREYINEISEDLLHLLNTNNQDLIADSELKEIKEQIQTKIQQQFPFPIAGFDNDEIFVDLCDDEDLQKIQNIIEKSKNYDEGADYDIEDYILDKNQLKAIHNAIENYLDGLSDKIIIRYNESNNITIETRDELLQYLSSIGISQNKIKSLKEVPPMVMEEDKNIEGVSDMYLFQNTCKFFVEELLNPLLQKLSTTISPEDVEKKWKSLLADKQREVLQYENLLSDILSKKSDDLDKEINDIQQKIKNLEVEYKLMEEKFEEQYNQSVYAHNLIIWLEFLQGNMHHSIEKGVPFVFNEKIYSTENDVLYLAKTILFEYGFGERFSLKEKQRLIDIFLLMMSRY